MRTVGRILDGGEGAGDRFSAVKEFNEAPADDDLVGQVQREPHGGIPNSGEERI